MDSTVLGAGVMGVVWVKIGCSLTFSTFWVKPAIIDHISVVVGYGSGELEEVEDCVSDEKRGNLVKYCS